MQCHDRADPWIGVILARIVTADDLAVGKTASAQHGMRIVYARIRNCNGDALARIHAAYRIGLHQRNALSCGDIIQSVLFHGDDVIGFKQSGSWSAVTETARLF